MVIGFCPLPHRHLSFLPPCPLLPFSLPRSPEPAILQHKVGSLPKTKMRFSLTVAIATLASTIMLVSGASLVNRTEAGLKRDGGRAVFAHVVVGILDGHTADDWKTSMQQAQSIGIDAFALNVGTDDYTTTQLDLAYQAASDVGFKVFISFDFAYFPTGSVDQVYSIAVNYVTKGSQYMYNNRPLISSFIGREFDWATLKSQLNSATGVEPFLLPNSYATDAGTAGIDGLFAWASNWPSQNNQPIAGPATTDVDNDYLNNLASTGGVYMAGVSPWFSTHFSSKNYLYFSDGLFQTRWEQLLNLNSQFAEIVTWNDFGESHYITTPGEQHTDDGSSAWTFGFDHSGWQQIAKPYIAAYKAGSKTPSVSGNTIVYWYRPFLKDGNCGSPDAVGLGKPDGTEYISDALFAVALLETAGTVTLTSGGNTQSWDAPAGINAYQVSLGTGQQSVSYNGASASGNLQVTADCQNNVWNYNAFVASQSF